MLAKFKSLDDSAFPQEFAPIAGRFLKLSLIGWKYKMGSYDYKRAECSFGIF
jgi:hypothetical protein